MHSEAPEKRVHIPLKALTTAASRVMPPALSGIIQAEYASRYCESIGVTANKDCIDYLLSVMPVKDASVAPNWTTCALEIIPGRGSETAGQARMRAAREKDAILEGKNVTPKMTSPTKGVSYNFTTSTVDPTSGAIPVSKKTSIVKKEIPKNTLSFRLLIKTLCEVGVDDLEVMSFKELLRPVTYDDEDTGCALRSFFECMSAFVPQFKDEGEVSPIHLKVIKFLQEPVCQSFFGLLLRYAYWNVIHPVARAVLKNGKLSHPEMFNNSQDHSADDVGGGAGTNRYPRFQNSVQGMNGYTRDDDDSSVTSQTSSTYSLSVSMGHVSDTGFALSNASLASETSLGTDEKEQLFLKLEVCMNALNKSMNFSYSDMSVGQRAFIACCHFVCDEITKHKYKWFVLEAAIAAASAKRSHRSREERRHRAAYITSKNLDYCRLQFQRAVHECISDILDPMRLYGTNLVRKEAVENMLPSGTTTKVRGQYNMTSASVRAIMGSAASPEARRFLSRTSVESYVPIPGYQKPELKSDMLQRGATYNDLLLPPEMTWNGTTLKGGNSTSKNVNSNSGYSANSTNSSSVPYRRPFSSTVIKKQHAEIPLSAMGKNTLYHLVLDKQKEKYSGHHLDKFARFPDVKSRTVLLDPAASDVGASSQLSPSFRDMPVMSPIK